MAESQTAGLTGSSLLTVMLMFVVRWKKMAVLFCIPLLFNPFQNSLKEVPLPQTWADWLWEERRGTPGRRTHHQVQLWLLLRRRAHARGPDQLPWCKRRLPPIAPQRRLRCGVSQELQFCWERGQVNPDGLTDCWPGGSEGPARDRWLSAASKPRDPHQLTQQWFTLVSLEIWGRNFLSVIFSHLDEASDAAASSHMGYNSLSDCKIDVMTGVMDVTQELCDLVTSCDSGRCNSQQQLWSVTSFLLKKTKKNRSAPGLFKSESLHQRENAACFSF